MEPIKRIWCTHCATQWTVQCPNAGRVKRFFFLFSKTSRLTLGTTQSLFSGYLGSFPGRFHIMPRLRMDGSVLLLPVYDFMAMTEKTLLYFTLLYSTLILWWYRICYVVLTIFLRKHVVLTVAGLHQRFMIFRVLKLSSRVTDFWRLEGKYLFYINFLKPTGYVIHHQFNIQQLYVLPTQCIYVFCVDLRTNSDYFPIQH